MTTFRVIPSLLTLRTLTRFTAIALCCLALQACGATVEAPQNDSDDAFPTKVENDGRTVRLTEKPSRIVSVGSFAGLVKLLNPDATVIPAWGAGKKSYAESHPWEAKQGLADSFGDGVINKEFAFDSQKLISVEPDLVVTIGFTTPDPKPFSKIAPMYVIRNDASWRDWGADLAALTASTDRFETLKGDYATSIKEASERLEDQIAGRTVLVGGVSSDGTVAIDPRSAVNWLDGLGLEVESLSDKPDETYKISLENLNKLRADILILADFGQGSDGSPSENRKKIERSPEFKRLPSVANGGQIWITETQWRSIWDPSPATIDWTLDWLVPALEKVPN